MPERFRHQEIAEVLRHKEPAKDFEAGRARTTMQQDLDRARVDENIVLTGDQNKMMTDTMDDALKAGVWLSRTDFQNVLRKLRELNGTPRW